MPGLPRIRVGGLMRQTSFSGKWSENVRRLDMWKFGGFLSSNSKLRRKWSKNEMPFGYEVVALEIRAASKGLSIRLLCITFLLRSSATSPQAVFLLFRCPIKISPSKFCSWFENLVRVLVELRWSKIACINVWRLDYIFLVNVVRFIINLYKDVVETSTRVLVPVIRLYWVVVLNCYCYSDARVVVNKATPCYIESLIFPEVAFVYEGDVNFIMARKVRLLCWTVVVQNILNF